MEYRNLHLTLISASGLKAVNKIRKMDVYAKAYLHGYPKTKKKTKPDKNCGTSPTWNHKMQFMIDEHSLTVPGLALDVHIKADVVGLDKEMGEVSIPVPQLFDDCGKTAGVERMMEYEVKTPSGKVKGTLKLSCLFGEKYRLHFPCDGQPSPGKVARGCSNDAHYPLMEHYPHQHEVMGCPFPGGASPSAACHSGKAARYPSTAHPRPHHQGYHGACTPNGGGYAPAPSPGYAATAASGYEYCQQHQVMMQSSNDQQQLVHDNGGKHGKKKSKKGKNGGGTGPVSVGSVGGTNGGDVAYDMPEVFSGDDEMLAGDKVSSTGEMASGVGDATADEADEMVDGAGELATDAIGDMASDAGDITSSAG